MAKNIVIFYEDKVEIYRGLKLISIIKLPDYTNIGSHQNINFLCDSVRDKGIKIKNCHLVYAMDGLLTRTIEIPKIKKSLIDSYIENNIDEYFSVNMSEYYYDYKISKIEKKYVNLFIAAAPKHKIDSIKYLLEQIGITIKSIRIYPELVSSLFKDKKGGYGLIDISENRTYVTLFNDGDVFLHSLIINEFSDSEQMQEYIDNIIYFLNFYAARHFGNKIRKLFVIGQVEDELKSALIQQIDIEVEFDVSFLNRNSKYNIIIYSLLKNNAIGQKKLDFINFINKRGKIRHRIVNVVLIILFMTILWTLISLLVIQKKAEKYNLDLLKKRYEAYNDIEKSINDLEAQKNILMQRKKIIEEIKSEELDVVDILTKIRNKLPQNILISEITIDKQNVNAVFVAKDGKTLDAAKLVVALNRIGIFEEVELDEIELDDNVNDIELVLKLKNK